MKTWVLKSNDCRYLCNGSREGCYELRYKYELLKESDIVFHSDKRELQNIADKWNSRCAAQDQHHVRPVLVLYMFDEVEDKITNAEKYTTREDRLIAFHEMCDRYRFTSRYTMCEGCKYREKCDSNAREYGVLAWLEDEVEEIPYKITRTYTKTITLQASSKDEARRLADRKFKELEETKTIEEASLNYSSTTDKVVTAIEDIRGKATRTTQGLEEEGKNASSND